MFLSVLIPLGCFWYRGFAKVRRGLYLAAVFCLLGFMTNRLNVAITGMESAVGGLTPQVDRGGDHGDVRGAGFAIFGLAAKYLPIFPEEKVHTPALREREAAVDEMAVPVHAGD